MEVNVKNTNNIISKVYKNSIAEELGIEVDDILISINGQKIQDIIEYKFLISDEYLEVEIQKKKLASLEMKIDEMTSLDRIKEVSLEYGLSYNANNVKTIK